MIYTHNAYELCVCARIYLCMHACMYECMYSDVDTGAIPGSKASTCVTNIPASPAACTSFQL